MEQTELNIQFSKEVYRSHYNQLLARNPSPIQTFKTDLLARMVLLLILGVAYGTVCVQALQWSWAFYWVGAFILITQVVWGFLKNAPIAKKQLTESQQVISEWLEERARVANYKVVLDPAGISIIEDGKLTLYLPKEEINVLVCNENTIYLAKGINEPKKTLLFLKDSMAGTNFQTLVNYTEDELKNVQRYVF